MHDFGDPTMAAWAPVCRVLESLPECDPRLEAQPFLRRFKAELLKNQQTNGFLRDACILQGMLIALGRYAEAIRIAEAVEAVAAVPPGSDPGYLMADETVRGQIDPAGAYAAIRFGQPDTARVLLSRWGSKAFGPLARTNKKDLRSQIKWFEQPNIEDRYRKFLDDYEEDADKEKELIGMISEGLTALCMDFVILNLDLPGAERLKDAGFNKEEIQKLLSPVELLLRGLIEKTI